MFFLGFWSTSDAFFKCFGNFAGVDGYFQGQFRLYNKRKKTMYAQAKKLYAHPSENSRVWDKNKHFT